MPFCLRATHVTRALAAAVCVAAWGAPLLAHKGAHGIVHERMEMMKSISASMKSVDRMLRSRNAYDATKVKAAGTSIEAHAKHMLAMFPNNSLDKPTEALPAIWLRWPEFERETGRMEEYARALKAAADHPDGRTQSAQVLKQLTSTCSGCHKPFRKGGR